MNFKNLYENTTDKIKLEFLDAIISENQNLQTAFMNYANSVKDQTAGISFQRYSEIVTETTKYYKERFEEVDLENPDWENYRPTGSGYMEEWEQYQEASEQEFDEIFDEFKTRALDAVIQQKPDELMAMLTGLYEAACDADVPDPYDSFYDVNEHLLDDHKYVMHEVINKVLLSAISGSSVGNTCELFFRYAGKEYPGNEHFPAYFEDFLLALCGKSNQPGRILSILNQSGVGMQSVPQLVLLLHQKEGNTKQWLQSALQFYKRDYDVALQLLAYYFNKNKPEFLKLANELFEKEPGYWAKKLREYISAELDTALFIKVFYRLVVDEKSMTDFHKLRPYLPDEELEKLLQETKHDTPFIVRVLAAEHRYEEIKRMVELEPGDWHFPEMISPLLEVYPEFCFNKISTKARHTIENERGRGVYQRVVEWLQLADAIPGFKPQARLLARELYNHKPNLPALKDELRQGGLV